MIWASIAGCCAVAAAMCWGTGEVELHHYRRLWMAQAWFRWGYLMLLLSMAALMMDVRP